MKKLITRSITILKAFAAMAMVSFVSAATAADNVVTVKATPLAGQVFAGWYTNTARVAGMEYTGGGVDYRTAQMTYSASTVDALFAKFVSKEEDKSSIAIDCKPSESNYVANAMMELPVKVVSCSLPTVTAVGMPKGVTFDARKLVFSGRPSQPGEAAVVKITAKNLSNTAGFTTNVTIKIGNTWASSLPELKYADGYEPFVPGLAPDMANILGPETMSTLAEGGWTVTGLPAGMSFNSRTGQFSGAPTQPGATCLVTFKKGTEMATVTFRTGAFPTLALEADVRDSALGQVTDAAILAQVRLVGAGTYAVGKVASLSATAPKGWVFAGWYLGEQPVGNGQQDYRTGSGYKYTMPASAASGGVTIRAAFVPSSVDSALSINCAPAESYAANAAMELPVEVVSCSLPTVSAAGMPKGVTFDARKLVFTGKPSQPGEAAVVKITAKNLSNTAGFTTNVTIKVSDARSGLLPGLKHDDPAAYPAFVPGLAPDMAEVLGAETMSALAKGGWTVTGLPAGMSFNSRTGEFSGAPTQPGVTCLVTFRKGSETATVTLRTERLPEWLTGNFTGCEEGVDFHVGKDYYGNDSIDGWSYVDLNNATIAANGRITRTGWKGITVNYADGRIVNLTIKGNQYAENIPLSYKDAEGRYVYEFDNEVKDLYGCPYVESVRIVCEPCTNANGLVYGKLTAESTPPQGVVPDGRCVEVFTQNLYDRNPAPEGLFSFVGTCNIAFSSCEDPDVKKIPGVLLLTFGSSGTVKPEYRAYYNNKLVTRPALANPVNPENVVYVQICYVEDSGYGYDYFEKVVLAVKMKNDGTVDKVSIVQNRFADRDNWGLEQGN